MHPRLTVPVQSNALLLPFTNVGWEGPKAALTRRDSRRVHGGVGCIHVVLSTPLSTWKLIPGLIFEQKLQLLLVSPSRLRASRLTRIARINEDTSSRAPRKLLPTRRSCPWRRSNATIHNNLAYKRSADPLPATRCCRYGQQERPPETESPTSTFPSATLPLPSDPIGLVFYPRFCFSLCLWSAAATATAVACAASKAANVQGVPAGRAEVLSSKRRIYTNRGIRINRSDLGVGMIRV